MIMPVVELNDPKGESIELFDDEHKLFKKPFVSSFCHSWEIYFLFLT